jgi:peptidoglycan hydrolase-like protein with peptidoglycan-binding domain
MRLWVWVAGWLLLWGGNAAAQDRAWVQIESFRTLAEAEQAARARSSYLPDVAGFRVASGWYAIVLGPYSRTAAEARLATLLAENLIPADSLISVGEVYRQPFWPVGADPAATGPLTLTVDPAPAPAAEPEPAPPPVTDETLSEARASEAALDRDQRKALQDGLKFFGFYGSAIDGAFGAGTRSAMSAWQETKGYDPTGTLTTRQRAELLDDRARIEAELGLATVTEEEAGIEMSLPLALVAFDRYEPPFVHFAEKDGSGVRVALISAPGDEATLSGLYDILQRLDAIPVTGARSLRDRGFTIEGADSRGAAYAEARLEGGLVKGFLILWAPEKSALAGRALSAMKASFKPVGKRALDPGLVPLDDSTRAGMLSGLEVRRPAFSRSGLWVSDTGQVLTVAEAVQGCSRITLDNGPEAEVTFADAGSGLALLTPRKPLSPPEVAGIDTAAPREGGEVAVAGYPYEDALPAPTLTYGVLAAATGLNGETGLRRLDLAARPGDAGGPVLDTAGAVVGMLLARPAADSGQVLPEGVAFAAGGAALAERLAAAGVTAAAAARDGALAPNDLAARAARITVLVGCWN